MKRTLVLAVDRDDDFGVKGRVVTPVIGIQNCMEAANSLGLADPEDSDLNALYAAVSTCMELQEEGFDAEVALICGDEKVGHKSDLAVVAQLEEVLDVIKPDNVILIGDGAEDEYIYPIISSRSHVDSVRKVYVKQAPNIESSFYVISKMLSEPNKRKRFIAPIAALVVIISLFVLLPDLVVLLMNGDISTLPAISRDIILMIIGIGLLMYAYKVSDKWTSFNQFVKERIFARGTVIIMTALALGVCCISAIMCYFDLMDTYFTNDLAAAVYYMSSMVWPIVISIMIYIFGIVLDDIQEESVFRISSLFDCLSLACLGMVMIGLLDIILYYISPGYDFTIGLLEILVGVVMTISFTFTKNRYRPKDADPAAE